MGKPKPEVMQLRVPLEGEDLEKFNRLKEKFGLSANTETFRFMLNKFASTELAKEASG